MIHRSFYFIRHGQTDWNLENRVQGQTNIPLNDTGKQQAYDSIPFLKELNIDVICSSTMDRAVETASIINSSLDIQHIRHNGIIERHHGILEGKTANQIITEELIDYSLPAEPSGLPLCLNEEPFEAVIQRAISTIDTILRENPNKTVLFVAHGDIFSAITYALINDSVFRLSDNCTPYYFERTNDNQWIVTNLKNNTDLTLEEADNAKFTAIPRKQTGSCNT